MKPELHLYGLSYGEDSHGSRAAAAASERHSAEDDARNAELTRLCRLGYGNVPPEHIPLAVRQGANIPYTPWGTSAKHLAAHPGRTCAECGKFLRRAKGHPAHRLCRACRGS